MARVIELTSYAEVVLAPPGGGRGPSGLQQSLRADGIRAEVLGDPLHPARQLPGRQAALAAAPDGGPGRRTGEGVLRDGPRALHRAGPHPRQPRRDAGARAFVQHHRLRARPDHFAPAHGLPAAERNGDRRPGDRGDRKPGVRAGAGGKVPEFPHGRPHFRPGVDPQPGHVRHLNATEGGPTLRADGGRAALRRSGPSGRPSVLRTNRRGQSGLWSYGISGDAPIVLLQIGDPQKSSSSSRLVRAHAYWRMKGLTVELMILNEDRSIYRQPLQEEITALIASGVEARMLDKPGGIFVRRREQVPRDDLVLLQAAARIVLNDEDGTLAEQLERRGALEPPVPPFAPTRSARPEATAPLAPRDLGFPTAWAASPATGTSMSSPSSPDRRPRPRGSTCWPIRPSARSSPRAAPPTAGRRTPMSFASRPGVTIRSGIPPARPSTSGTSRPGNSGRRRRCRPGAPRPTSSATASATRSSSMRKTASPPSSGSTWRWMRRSNSRS